MGNTSLPSLTTWWQSALAHSTSHRLRSRSYTGAPHAHKHSCVSGAFLSSSICRHTHSRHHPVPHKQTQHTKHRQATCPAAQASGDHIADVFDINSADTNQLQTALNRAIAAEDYVTASQVRDQLQSVVGGDTGTADWRDLGVPEWLADRAERMGFKYATGLPWL